MRKTFFYIFCLFTISTSVFGQRTLYIDDFNNIIGSPSKEDKLLLFAKKNNVKTLILYQLNKVDKKWSLKNPNTNNVLADFISKAKNEFSIHKVGASGECASFFTETINPYNNSRNSSDEKIDIYNLEYEYWSSKASGEDGYYCINYLSDNSIPCTRNGSFNFFIENLKEMKQLSKNNTHEIKTEAYLGFFSQKEIKSISKYCDRLIIQAHGKNPRKTFTSARKSLEFLLKTKIKIKTSILFSTKMADMGYWFKSHSLSDSEQLFLNEMNKSNINFTKNLNLVGFSYHTYSYLEKSVNYFYYTRN